MMVEVIRKMASPNMTSNTYISEQSSEPSHRLAPQSTASTRRAMTPNTPRERVVEFTDEADVRHRIRFVPRKGTEWWRVEEAWTGSHWRCVDRNLVTELDQWSRPVSGTPERRSESVHD